jgi:mannose-1-phosphate guanylyltransferase
MSAGAAAIGLVLAGGQGTRMGAGRPGTPKPLVEVCGVPLLELALRHLASAGLIEVHVALRHEAARIQEFLDELAPRLPALEVHTLVEDQPLGTIGAAHRLRDQGRTVLAVNADLVSAIDLAALLRQHREHGAHLTVATHDEHHRLRLGEVIVDPAGRVLDYLEKPVKSYRISSGTYAIEPDVLALVRPNEWLGFPALVQRALAAGLDVREAHHVEPWIDVNEAADLARAEELLASDPVAFGLDARAASRRS